MVAFYAVVQYTPDPNGDERVNIGLLTCGNGIVRGRCLQRWNRVTYFGSPDARFLETVFYDLETTLEGSDDPESELRRLSASWVNAVRITPLRASMLDSNALLEEMTPRVLREPAPRVKNEFRTASKATSVVRSALRAGLIRQMGKQADHFDFKEATIRGALFTHPFGASVQNGMIYGAADGISFEIPDVNTIQRNVDTIINAVTDVREVDAKTPLGVIAFPPYDKLPAYTTFCNVLEKKNVAVFSNDAEAQAWAITAIAPYIAAEDPAYVTA